MEDQKEFNEKLDKIRNITIIEVNRWWGGKNSGYSGTIITENKEIYSYQYYSIIPKELEGKNVNFISKNKELNVEEYNKIKKFIENEIVDKEFYAEKIFDAGFDVIVNYKGTRKRIQNNKGVKDKLKIYDKVQILINELLEND